MAGDYILVIDEGTTSTRAIAFDRDFAPRATAQQEVPLSFPKDGWVEQDGLEIWSRSVAVARAVIDEVGGVSNIAGLGLANQRETTLIWDRATGQPAAPAIVWQDRRTAAGCEDLKRQGAEPEIQAETGLLVDPYFSASKLAWLLGRIKDGPARAADGELAFGTVDSWLIWRLTAGASHLTDVTNASRTLLYRLGLGGEGGWSPAMADLFGAPLAVLPGVRPCASDFGHTAPPVFGAPLPILSAVGDQQAALVGQGCLKPGQAKITYGTGAFLVANTGAARPQSAHRLLATIGFEAAGEGAYALEGSIFNAGTVVKWLRDELGLVSDAADTESMAADLPDNGGVYMAPAFTGLGAPHWNAEARGVITGLSRGTRAAHIVRAGLEAAAYQTRDLMDAFVADGARVDLLKVDGGMAANDWLMQFVADVCDTPVERPDYAEMTALGAAALAGVQLGWITLDDWAARNAPGRRFEPAMDAAERDGLLAGWRRAIDATLA